MAKDKTNPRARKTDTIGVAEGAFVSAASVTLASTNRKTAYDHVISAMRNMRPEKGKDGYVVPVPAGTEPRLIVNRINQVFSRRNVQSFAPDGYRFSRGETSDGRVLIYLEQLNEEDAKAQKAERAKAKAAAKG